MDSFGDETGFNRVSPLDASAPRRVLGRGALKFLVSRSDWYWLLSAEPTLALTERDTYEIIVDTDAWLASRSALADAVAGVLGVPAHRIHPVLHLQDAPIAQYAHQEEADRVAEELASKGLDVSVRRRLRRRKSLQELTRRAAPSAPNEEPSSTHVNPEPVVVEEVERPALPTPKTMKPGWLSLDDSGPASPFHKGTAVGIPAWTDPSESPVAPPAATENAELDHGALNALMAIEATADTVEPGAHGGLWSDILGAALADRVVDDGSSVARSGIASAVAVSPSARRNPQPPAAEPASPVQSEAAAAPPIPDSNGSRPSGSATVSAHTLVAPVGAETLHPAHSRAQLAAGVSGAGEPSTAPVDDETAGVASAWAIAGVDVASEVVNAPGGVLRPVASMDERGPSIHEKPPSTGTMLMNAAEAFAGFDEAAMATAGEPLPPADQLTVGDKFVRLRQPSQDERKEGPEPSHALLWGIAAPGAGFVYLGEPSRGYHYALGAILIVPWIKGALDAAKLAADVKDGRTLLRRTPDPLARVLYVSCFWAFVALVAFAAASLIPGSRGSGEGELAVQPVVNVDTGSESTIPEPLPEPEPAEEESTEPEVDPQQTERQLHALVREARLACEEGRYAECERLAGEALDIDGRNRQALILQVEAVSHSSRTRRDPSETDNDRQPDSPSP